MIGFLLLSMMMANKLLHRVAAAFASKLSRYDGKASMNFN
jgi:hypothetical protein